MKFNHPVTLKEIPKIIYDKEHPSWEMFFWLHHNIGPGAVLKETDGVWTHDLEYSKDGQNIITTFRFEKPADATMFSLKWA